MRAMLALVLHLGGVAECMRLIWEWSVHNQESGDLQLLLNSARATSGPVTCY